PGAPSPGITVPTTSYRSSKPLPRNALPIDFYAERTAHNHGPLVWLLVLTQLSVGAFCVEQLLARLAPGAHTPLHAAVALTLGLLALNASILHLGRPLYAFRAILGIRTSWMSREIAAFGGFAGLASAYAAMVAVTAGWLSGVALTLPASLERAIAPLGLLVSASGLFAVFCSVMLYAVTGRRWWSVPRTTFRFFGTAAVLGTATSLFVTLASAVFVDGGELDSELASVVRHLGIALVALTSVKLGGEATVFLHLRDSQRGELRRSAQLLARRLHRSTFFRFFVSGLGGAVLPLLVVIPATEGSAVGPFIASSLGVLLCVAGEAIERTTFFTAVSAPRMPGAHV
ncbi:MAG: dimethyl sulfoxide reductase anchor subunit, partial [Polyangiaceae bacterium]|nr:dimethyl sulfoxide reductase anchor subunit [Polyangiaceae bacterium]